MTGISEVKPIVIWGICPSSEQAPAPRNRVRDPGTAIDLATVAKSDGQRGRAIVETLQLRQGKVPHVAQASGENEW